MIVSLCHQLHTVKAHTFRDYTQTPATALQGQRSLSKAIGQVSCTAEGKLLQVQEQVGHISGQQEEHQNQLASPIHGTCNRS